ncbi:MAG: hypothetical protein ACD_49C00067G0024 [uncultured bacterium (gcode 4)]|uniref:Uncharacterized protein n=1 Tax=uncultured bacterium (gcode 4) TaxID=1234023 RepID=K2BBA3_9BACT|nr:MAG: hypothetical protein ACD_49C00067G0024 [uncultured bacterium (gcode 4)]
MATIEIENAPVTYKVSYSDCILIEKDKLSEGINRLKESFYNPDRETYWPFEDEDAISFLKLLDYEDRI